MIIKNEEEFVQEEMSFGNEYNTLLCGKCKQIKNIKEFTNANRSKKGTGLCIACKQERDINYRKIKNIKQSELNEFELIPDILINKKERPRIGVLMLENIIDRTHSKGFFDKSNFGINAILKELNEPYEYTTPAFINIYEFILITLTSVMDIENLIYTFECFVNQPVKPKIIVGGFGCINIKLIIPYIDIAVFGRAEGQINKIISGSNLSNVWRKSNDPMVESSYTLRQPQYLLDGENSIGCRGKCKFCQYTYTRKALCEDQKYNAGKGMSIQETDWKGLDITTSGRYTSAWDGWSEQTRFNVSKPISDNNIIDKLVNIGNLKDVSKNIFIKIFQIIGYPNETIESVSHDIKHVKDMLERINNEIQNKIVLAYACTPFGPEPLTPMQYMPGNININWREEFNGINIYDGEKINAFILPVISGSYTLLKRMMINRAEMNDLELFKKIAFSSKLRNMPERYKVPYLMKHNIIDQKMFGEIDHAGFDYLKIGV